ncbi:MAG: hypothetical protein H7249_15505 [Chitinophagaceae bacterium]|nr:hypothetical protein [Oligoflexus sp.]
MQKLVALGLFMALNSCGQSSGPSVPDAIASADALPGASSTPYQSGEPSSVPSSPAPHADTSGDLMPNTSTLPVAPADIPPVETSTKAPDRTLTLSLNDNRGVWEGFGTSLGWWANGVGLSNFESLYADLLFTNKDVKFIDNKVLPGLGLSVVRYNVGGSGRAGDMSTLTEAENKAPSNDNAHDGVEPYRDIDGFWKDIGSTDPTSNSFDWTRDANQKSILTLAKRRGVNTFELYSNAPMWWMTAEHSAFGGGLLDEHKSNAMLYLALVAKQVRNVWGIPVSSIEPFNEPASNNWKFPVFQQGCNFALNAQIEELAYLKIHLTQQSVGDVKIASADESSPSAQTANNEYMKTQSAKHEGITILGTDLSDKVNVHTADAGVPFRDNGERDKLRASIGAKKLWVSDYNDSDPSGLALAETIFQDLSHLKPSAWIYFQAVEPYGAKGLVTGNFHMMPSDPAVRGKPTGVSVKYYVMAQFSRFLRAGQTLLGTGEEQSISAYDAASKKLTIVALNADSKERTMAIDLSQLQSFNQTVTMTVTRVDGSKLFKSKHVKILNNKVQTTIEPGSVISLELSEVVFP